MTPNFALGVCLCFVFALLVLDHRWRSRISIGGWIPLIWMLVIGSRPLTTWFFPSININSNEIIQEGSPIDRAFYLGMILAGFIVLFSRRFNWSQFMTRNKWLVLYFAYLLISVLWSDYTFIAFKRWIKDFGNVVMVLIVISESNPIAAVQSLLVRTSFILVPFSLVLIKYFPEISRYYDTWSGRGFYSGISINKNMLGMTFTVLGLALAWAFFESIAEKANNRKRLEILVYVIMLLLVAWQLRIADCATALASVTVGTIFLLFLRVRSVRKNIHMWITIGFIMIVILSVLGSIIAGPILQLLGRKPTLTDRDEIWKRLLKEDVNSFFGTGSYSFWMGNRAERVSVGFEAQLNEAHNGYLEIYLNVGLVGLVLFLVILTSATCRLVRDINRNENDKGESFCLSVIVVSVLYNITEATFNRLDLIWFGLLLVVARSSIARQIDVVPVKDVVVKRQYSRFRIPTKVFTVQDASTKKNILVSSNLRKSATVIQEDGITPWNL